MLFNIKLSLSKFDDFVIYLASRLHFLDPISSDFISNVPEPAEGHNKRHSLYNLFHYQALMF